MTFAEQYKQNYQRSYEEGQREAALDIAKRILEMRNDPEFMNEVLRCFIKRTTGISDQDLLDLEN